MTIKYCGLSPLARGTQVFVQTDEKSARFIPAGAGNTKGTRITYYVESVYPRWRGEHADRHDRILDGSGLSPLARGTLIGAVVVDDGLRFIPAGAGNTILFQLFLFCYPVYPRWRGEHILLVLMTTL